MEIVWRVSGGFLVSFVISKSRKSPLYPYLSSYFLGDTMQAYRVLAPNLTSHPPPHPTSQFDPRAPGPPPHHPHHPAWLDQVQSSEVCHAGHISLTIVIMGRNL